MGIELQEVDQQISQTTAQLEKVKTQRAKHLQQREQQMQQQQEDGGRSEAETLED